jgi:hypothetical protein
MSWKRSPRSGFSTDLRHDRATQFILRSTSISMLNRITCRRNRSHRLRKLMLLSAGTLLSVNGAGLAEEARIEIRKRTDPNVQADIRAVLELQSKHLESKPPLGLSELAAKPSNSIPQTTSDVVPATAASSIPQYEPAPISPTIIGSCDSVIVGASHEVVVQDTEAQRAPKLMPSRVGSQLAPAPLPSRVIVSGSTDSATTNRSAPERSLKILPPPQLSRIDAQGANGVGLPSQSITHRWRPVSAQVGISDSESTMVPSLTGSVRVGDSAVSQAAFQAPPGGGLAAPPPNMPSSPSNLVPSTGMPPQGIFPTSPSNQGIFPNSTQPGPINQGLGNSGVPGTLSPYPNINPQSNLPTPRPNIVGGEPFVTGPGCQFDASYMVEPTCYMASTGCADDGVSGTQPTFPYTGVPNVRPPYTGIPGTIIPPTYMPNQVPGGLYSGNNSGFRPLFGFGQDNYNVQLGRGIIGQPVAYVVGQPIRNFLRYVFP